MKSSLAEHPTVKAFHAKGPVEKLTCIDAERLRQLCLECGADDMGFVALGRPELDDQRAAILEVFPLTKTLIAFVVKMQREPVRSKFRSLANSEFHLASDYTSEVGHNIAARLETLGIGAMNEPMAFPMEVNRFPEQPPWVISHKPIAEAAGLGKMGLHRNVIHPKFGNFILLGTVLIDAEVSQQSQPLDFNPCLDCKLCVAACPVGAIAEDGHFDFTACYTHNYREFLGGFTDWVAIIADSKHGEDYRERVSDAETVSQWQSLSFGPNYKAAYCMAVCPAGEDVIGPFLQNRKGHVQGVLRPLQEKVEPVYVLPNSDAEAHVERRFPHKTVRHVRSMTRPDTLAALWRLMPHAFQRGQAKGLSATYHFTFTGKEAGQKTVVISEGIIAFCEGYVGTPNVRVVADSGAWLKVSTGQLNVLRAIATRRVRVRGDLRALKRFSACFPN